MAISVAHQFESLYCRAVRRRWVSVIEIATSFVAAAACTFAFAAFRGAPLDRIGQVSALATIALRFLAVAIPLVVALAVAARVRSGVAFDTVARLVCAAIAGIASATFAAGILFALRGTPFGLGATSGDAAALCMWADSVKRGDFSYSSVYPPLQVHLLAWVSSILHMPTAHAMKAFQVLGVAAIGPATYAAWRLLMRPGWALGAALVSMLTLIEPYRPYAGLVLAVLLPVLVKFLDVLRHVGTLPLQRVMQYAALFGLGLGLLCLLYSGWYQWSAPGFVVAALIVFPWRDWRRGTLFCAIAGVVFGLCVWHYVMGFTAGTGIKDTYVNADVLIEPTYFAMSRGGSPDNPMWPPLGELGGVGVFTVILAVGLAIALALGRRQTSVIALVSLLTGCWLFRLWYAHKMWQTKLVQLYPRTSFEILCCMLVLCVIAVYLLVQRSEPTSVWRSPSAMVAAVSSLVLVIMSSSSATIDQYLPHNKEGTTGQLAWMAQRMRKKKSVALGAEITTSSSLETTEYSTRALIDGDLKTSYSSALGRTDDHEEWIELRWDQGRRFSHIILHAAADGFPLDFAIDVWNGSEWVTRRDLRYAPEPYGGMLVELFTGGYGGSDLTTGFRLRAKKLRKAKGSDDYVLRLAEIELR